MEIKDIRLNLGLTQDELATLVGVSTRTIRRYEAGDINKYKRSYILKLLDDFSRIDEEHGILEYDAIVKGINKVANNYNIEFVYLFGSYARKQASPVSDIDLLIKTSEKGLKYFGIIEDLRVNLKKKIDLINADELINNQELLLEILRDGIKVYG